MARRAECRCPSTSSALYQKKISCAIQMPKDKEDWLGWEKMYPLPASLTPTNVVWFPSSEHIHHNGEISAQVCGVTTCVYIPMVAYMQHARGTIASCTSINFKIFKAVFESLDEQQPSSYTLFTTIYMFFLFFFHFCKMAGWWWRIVSRLRYCC